MYQMTKKSTKKAKKPQKRGPKEERLVIAEDPEKAKLPKAHQIGQPVPYHDDPVMARLCADTGRSQGER